MRGNRVLGTRFRTSAPLRRALDARLRRRAAAEQIPMSALVRRLITRAVQGAAPGELTEARVEEIARRVVREESSPAGRAQTP